MTPTPRVLTVEQVQTILDACQHLRDRLLFALLLDTGLRVGEALGLRHEDLTIAERQVLVVPRRNDNGARAKAGRRRTTHDADRAGRRDCWCVDPCGAALPRRRCAARAGPAWQCLPGVRQP